MSQTVFGRIARPAVMFIAGVLAASALSSTVVAAPARVASTLTRVTSCAGLNFHPIDSGTTFEWDGRILGRTTPAGDGWFLCDANLPDKAIVTKLRFTVLDDNININVRYCALVRAGLGTTGGAPETVAEAIRQTGMQAEPGVVRGSTTKVSHGTIDEANFGYWLQCQIFFSPNVVATSAQLGGIIGADVTYKISSTNG